MAAPPPRLLPPCSPDLGTFWGLRKALSSESKSREAAHADFMGGPENCTRCHVASTLGGPGLWTRDVGRAS